MRTIRALSALSLLCLASGIVRAQTQPEWGTQDYHAYTLYAWDFEPLDGRMTFADTSPGSFMRYCVSSSAPYPACYLEAGVDLPQGVLIDSIFLAQCRNDADIITATLYTFSGIPGSSVVIGQAGPLSSGCGGTGSLTLNHTTAGQYAIEVSLPIGNPDVSFRSVSISYRFQVSPAPGTATFNDVPTNHPFFQFIEALANSGITAGCGGGNYCPDQPLTRGQMAVFLAKALGLHWE
jgi:S-layer homology domain